MFGTLNHLKEADQLPPSKRTKFVVPTGSAQVVQLAVYEQFVRVTDSAYTCTIVLPPVDAAAGLEYNISCISGSYDVTITDYPNGFTGSRDWSDLTLTAAEDQVTLKSDGIGWIIVENKAT